MGGVRHLVVGVDVRVANVMSAVAERGAALGWVG